MPVDGRGERAGVRHPVVAAPGAGARAGIERSTALGTGLGRRAILGAVIAGSGDGRFRVTAVIYPEWNLENSGPFYVIESAHAVAETAMVPALVWLWKASARAFTVPVSSAFGSPFAATTLLAAMRTSP
jgi:hypothetical protein